MSAEFQIILRVVVIGVGATIVLDLWSACLKRFFRIPSANWAMVGRWFGHLPRGRFVHSKIADASPVRGELLLGWSVHYAIGVGVGCRGLHGRFSIFLDAAGNGHRDRGFQDPKPECSSPTEPYESRDFRRWIVCRRLSIRAAVPAIVLRALRTNTPCNALSSAKRGARRRDIRLMRSNTSGRSVTGTSISAALTDFRSTVMPRNS